ncbi:Proline iminopeptidase [Smittium culicis]|uniref:Proline iminopeptidase n=1 Tax=Smittium culicis TaxID=133412 RepID=A0A1R1Y6J3_9FUNG|nr:Proline iminopeptidase [Smittium culicis]
MDSNSVHELDRTDIESYNIPGGKVFNRYFQCPLDYKNPAGKTIQSPSHASLSGGWVGIMLAQGYQVLLLDQRGTGLSSAINSSSEVLTLPTIEQQVEYMTHFRADSIVNDCEFIRKILVQGREVQTSGKPKGPSTKFTLLGQSFGGFCITTYLSFFPEGVEKAIITGGVPPLLSDPVEIYEKLIQKVLRRNELYYQTYHADIKRVRAIVGYLSSNVVYLPGTSVTIPPNSSTKTQDELSCGKKPGNILTPNRFQQLGLAFGGSSGFAAVHKIILNMENDLKLNNKISYKSLTEFEQFFSFETNVLYAILHESIYCNGPGSGASNWACSRALKKNGSIEAKFDSRLILSSDDSQPIYFFGEMIFPWMTQNIYGTELAKFSELADALSKYDNWSPLYNVHNLNKNTVPVAAVSYYDDP